MDPDFELITKVRQIYADTRGSYGSRRMSGQLRDDGFDIDRHRARSLMKKADILKMLKIKVGRSSVNDYFYLYSKN
ncbi:MAG: IS3 family transposase [Desulfobacterales bacterium]